MNTNELEYRVDNVKYQNIKHQKHAVKTKQDDVQNFNLSCKINSKIKAVRKKIELRDQPAFLIVTKSEFVDNKKSKMGRK